MVALAQAPFTPVFALGALGGTNGFRVTGAAWRTGYDVSAAGDGCVDSLDLATLLARWGAPGTGDLDGMGIVWSADIAILLAPGQPSAIEAVPAAWHVLKINC